MSPTDSSEQTSADQEADQPSRQPGRGPSSTEAGMTQGVRALYAALRSISLALTAPIASPGTREALEWARERTARSLSELAADDAFWTRLEELPVPPSSFAPDTNENAAFWDFSDTVTEVLLNVIPQHPELLSGIAANCYQALARPTYPLFASFDVAVIARGGLFRLQTDLEKMALRVPSGGSAGGPAPWEVRLRERLRNAVAGLALITSAAIQGQPVAASIALNLAATAIWEGGKAIVTTEQASTPTTPLSFDETDLAELERLKTAKDKGLITDAEYQAARHRLVPVITLHG